MGHSGSLSRRNFLTAAAAAAGSALLPTGLKAFPPQDPIVNATRKDGKSNNREKVSWNAIPFPLQQVRLGEGPCKIAMEADRNIFARCRPIARCTLSASPPAFPPLPSHLADGRLPTANSVAITLAVTTFLLRADVCRLRRRRAQDQCNHRRRRTRQVPVRFEEWLPERLSRSTSSIAFASVSQSGLPSTPFTKSWRDCSTCTSTAATSSRSTWSRKWPDGPPSMPTP